MADIGKIAQKLAAIVDDMPLDDPKAGLQWLTSHFPDDAIEDVVQALQILREVDHQDNSELAVRKARELEPLGRATAEAFITEHGALGALVLLGETVKHCLEQGWGNRLEETLDRLLSEARRINREVDGDG